MDRTETPYGMTKSLCPNCRNLIDAYLVVREGKMVMRKWCPDHGWFEALISSDAVRYHDMRRFNKPGTIPKHFEREFHGCPDSCGICPEHQQHTCLGIIDVTKDCNLSCPVCFAGAQGRRGAHLSLDQISAMMDRLIRCEGNPEVIQLSGGEPTIHPHILEIVAMAREKGLKKILLNTNGVALDEDQGLVDKLAEQDPTIYLQFDGFEAKTYRALRGKDLSAQKMRVVEALTERDMRIVLVATVVRGINDHEIGALTDFALDHDNIRALNFQPATFTGRFSVKNDQPTDDPMDRVTLTELVELISRQSRFDLSPDDFFPIPCPDPACSMTTYVHQTGGEMRPLPRLVDVEDYLDYLKNTSVAQLTDGLRDALESLFSMSAVPGPDTTQSFCTACNVGVDWGEVEREITMISAMHFMDAYTFDLNRSRKCCIHQILPDEGGMIPFCNYNVLRKNR